MNSFGSKAQFLTTAVTLSYLLESRPHYGPKVSPTPF